MTITALHPTRLDRSPTDAELFPFVGLVDVCEYCGCFQTDAEVEDRTRDHIVRDLLAIHRAGKGLKRDFALDHPGYTADVHDLLCELDNADREALAGSEAQL